MTPRNLSVLVILLLKTAAVCGQEPVFDMPLPSTPADVELLPVPQAWCGSPDLMGMTPRIQSECHAIRQHYVWGIAGLKAVIGGEKIAANGVPFDPLFSVDLDFNLWLWP